MSGRWDQARAPAHLRARARSERETTEGAADRAAARAIPAEPRVSRTDRAATRAEVEQQTVREVGASMGHDFSRVRLHDDAAAHSITRRLGAEAITIGNDVLFAPGRRDPTTPAGRALLTHELAHVQQQAATGPRVQAKFVATGAAQDFVDMVNQIVTVQHRVEVSKSGEISIVDSGVQGPPTRSQIELLARIRSMIADAKTTTIDFVHGNTSKRAGDDNIIVGNYATSRVDLDDISAFGFEPSEARTGDNAATELVHELTEQQLKQVEGKKFEPAHKAAYAAQEKQLGAKLTGETVVQNAGKLTVTTSYRYPDGREVDVIWIVDTTDNRVTSVNRVVRPPGAKKPTGKTP